MKRLILLSGLLCLFSGLSAQFNHLQTQYMTNPFVLNPACAGAQGYLSATASYRRQWTGFAGAPETFAFTMDSPIRNRHHNIGLIAMRDNIAVIHRSSVRAAYTYRITGRKSFFAAGLAPGISFNRYAWQDITTNAPDDAFGTSQNEVTYEVAYGLYFHSDHFFAGASGTYSGKSTVNTIVKKPFHLYAGYRFGKKEGLQWTISMLGRCLEPGYSALDANLNVMFRNKIGGGLSFRLNDAVAAMLQYRVNDQFLVGYSYDYSLSRLRNYNSGSHEIVLRYDFGYTVNAQSPR